MTIKLKISFLLLTQILIYSAHLYAQHTTDRKISVDELFSLAINNHPNLKVSRMDVEISSQDISITKNQYLPDIAVGLRNYYIGDVTIIDKDFSNAPSLPMPHFGNTLSIEAKQLIWKGNVVQNTVRMSTLQEELTKLNYENNEQSIKLLVLGYYQDLYKLINQIRVYSLNIDLANKRLDNIKKYYKQGMVTRNDLIRGELQVSNLQLARQVIQNNSEILNKQLTMALGLDAAVKIAPDEAILTSSHNISLVNLFNSGVENHPMIKSIKKGIEINKIGERIINSERMPAFSAFAGNSLARPITTSNPVLDKYSHRWSTGIALTYNVESLYKTPKKLSKNKLQIEKSEEQLNEARQMLEVAVRSSLIKYNEALTQNQTLLKNKELAGENYRIIESKYNNQLAIILDIVDASNAKLDAELQYANSEINIIYAYYRLLRDTGHI